MYWIHLSLNFQDCQKLADGSFPQKKPAGIYKALILYLKKVIEALGPRLIRRYFFLFEPQPHLFLALELKDARHLDLIKDKIKQIKKPKFIASSRIDLDTRDGLKDDPKIDFLCAGTRYIFYKAGADYKPGYYNFDEVKLVHCFGNPLFASSRNELLFYLKCAYCRGLPLNITRDCLRLAGWPEKNIEKFLRWDLRKKS
ncbi:MAG: hypothetical protein HZA27_04985 [Candidatus Omnitrophica bacterium]|nr:hypothetical protein [Candidatus Omnitrophota bacterium]